MSSAWILALVLAESPATAAGVAAVGPGSLAAAMQVQTAGPPRSRDELRQAFTEAIRKTSKRASPLPEQVVPELVSLYDELKQNREIGLAERHQMRRTLKRRLEGLRIRLIGDNNRRRSELRRAWIRRRNGYSSAGETASAAGPPEIRSAMALIDLIQTTIAPETWAVNGGRGTISYYDPLAVLVIRQTAEVHHQLGGVLPQLRK